MIEYMCLPRNFRLNLRSSEAWYIAFSRSSERGVRLGILTQNEQMYRLGILKQNEQMYRLRILKQNEQMYRLKILKQNEQKWILENIESKVRLELKK